MDRPEQKFKWMAVTRDQVEVGDWLANAATVTEVVIGPRSADTPFEDVKAGEVLFRCGESYGSKGRIDGRMVIVGRKP